MKPFSAKKLPMLVLMIVLGLLSSPLGVVPARAAGVRYVMPGGTGDCSSWASACDLQAALSTAVSGDEIWVAAGTHRPTTGFDREATFQLKQGVALYGGFTGAEIARNQRDYEANPTILSGDLLGNDIEFDNNDENVYHVVTGADDAILDGFTITSGNANGVYPNNIGGGIINNDSSPMLTNLIFLNNAASSSGGGMLNMAGSNPTITYITFSNNFSAEDGGGMGNYSSSPSLTNVIFNANQAIIGAGVTNAYGSNPTFTNVIFSNNIASFDNEVISIGGGMFNHESNPLLTNVTFENNVSNKDGGGIFNHSGYPVLTNVTFSGNTAARYGGGAYNWNGSMTLIHTTFSENSSAVGGGIYGSNLIIRNTIFWGNTASIDAQIHSNLGPVSLSDSIVQGGYPDGTNIITTDPMLGILDSFGGFARVIPLLKGSSAIDTGNNTYCPAVDQRGISRPQGAGCDIGAYEFLISTFADVPATHWAWDWIERLYSAGITGGCGNGNYCPEEPVTRAQMSIFLLRGVHGSSYTPPLVGDSTGFSDVPVSYWASAWIKQFYAEGITGGCGSGVYCPDQSVTRAQMAIFLLRAKHGSSYSPPAVDGSAGFGDVAADYWAAAWVKQLAAEGITGGCGNGNYCPEEPVTRAQMAVFLVRAFGLP